MQSLSLPDRSLKPVSLGTPTAEPLPELLAEPVNRQPKPVEIAGAVVMTLVVVVMVGPVEYALVLPPLVVVVMMEEPVEMAESVEYA
jgi:hypothetical protein